MKMNENQKEKLLQFENPSKFNGTFKICHFKKNDNISEVKCELKKYSALYKTEKRLWAFFGKGNGIEKWTCLEVGSSKDIETELRGMLKLMVSKPREVKKDTTFHKGVYNFVTNLDKRSVKYRSMYELCEEFVIFEIDVPKYLENDDIAEYDSVNYAEVKFAVETKALYWNPAPSTNGNQEAKILHNVFNVF